MTTYNTKKLWAAILDHVDDVIDRGLITKEELEDVLDDMAYQARTVTSTAVDQWLATGAKEALREAIREVLERRITMMRR